MKNLMQDKHGAAMLLEAGIIIPFFLLLTGFFMWVFLYYVQIVVYDITAQFVADRCAAIIAKPWEYPENGMIPSEILPGDSNDTSFVTHQIYRQIFQTWPGSKIYGKTLQERVDNTFPTGWKHNYMMRFVEDFSDNRIVIKVHNYILGVYVTASIEQEYRIPLHLEYIGISDDRLTIKRISAASAYVEDPPEFIREIDLATKTIKTVMKKLGINNISDIFKAVRNHV